MLQHPYDIGSEIAVRTAIPGNTSAAVANSNVAVKGTAIDRAGESAYASSGGTGGPSGAGLAQSAVFNFQAVAGANAPVLTSLKGKIQHSDTTTDGDFSDFVPDTIPGTGSNPAGTVAGSTAGVTAFGTDGNIRVSLKMAKRYIRLVLTPVFTAANSTVFLTGSCALGGFVNTPVRTPTNP